MSLFAGGGSAQLVRDVGTSNAVQGFRVSGALHGARRSTSLPTTVLFQAGNAAAQVTRAIVVTAQLFLKVSGTYRSGTLWQKVAGVWRSGRLWQNISGTWK